MLSAHRARLFFLRGTVVAGAAAIPEPILEERLPEPRSAPRSLSTWYSRRREPRLSKFLQILQTGRRGRSPSHERPEPPCPAGWVETEV